ncbi:MAG: phosphodiester glycosidase family protein [Acidimicrobiales bacterium]
MRRRAVHGVVLCMVLGSLAVWPAPGRAAGLAVQFRSDPVPGVEVRGLAAPGLAVDVGRIGRGAPVRVEAIAAGPIASGVETTSAVCQRVGGILCVNADFAACRTCTTAFGGLVHGGVLQRSPVADHPQLTLGPTGPDAGPLGWGAVLEATVTYLDRDPLLGSLLNLPPVERVEKVSLGLDAVNRPRGANQVVLFTPPWGATTMTPGGGDEAVLGSGAATVGASVPVDPRALRVGAGATPIPGDGMVVSAEGGASARLRAFWAKAADPAAARRSVVLRPSLDRPAQESVGGYPVVLANGQTMLGGSVDPFVTGRNPRTLVGWNPAGDLLLITIDGRQPGRSDGASLGEAADVLRQVGATSGFNLDGGGSTTFVSLAAGRGRTPQVLNRPSDGTERRVTTVLAVIPVAGTAVRTSAAPAPPQPPPAPPGPPPPDPASTDGLPKRPIAPPPTAPAAPATTATPPPAAPAPPPALEPTVPVTESQAAALEVALPPPTPASTAAHRSATAVPAAIAGAALLAVTAATLRTSRRRTRPRRS